ncbi:hypothetical protein [Burkholderia stagnalis]|uniref:hypothetical protein n=2 Tax=Burkholderia stagnalis TaxID=1503054 RepID=UPI0012DA40F0|nr:hypothetical protein [Burkholderia stagnalis]
MKTMQLIRCNYFSRQSTRIARRRKIVNCGDTSFPATRITHFHSIFRYAGQLHVRHFKRRIVCMRRKFIRTPRGEPGKYDGPESRFFDRMLRPVGMPIRRRRCSAFPFGDCRIRHATPFETIGILIECPMPARRIRAHHPARQPAKRR